jgi:hypothetical protein
LYGAGLRPQSSIPASHVASITGMCAYTCPVSVIEDIILTAEWGRTAVALGGTGQTTSPAVGFSVCSAGVIPLHSLVWGQPGTPA